MDGLAKTIEQAIREAERLVRERGGSFEGWLWYILRPFGFMVRDKAIEIEIPNPDFTEAVKVIIDRETHEFRIEVEEVGEDG